MKDITLKQAIGLIKKKEISPVELLDGYLKNLEEDNLRSDKLNAVVYYNREKALEQINRVDASLPLAGIPLLIKDNINFEGFPLQCASSILKGYVSPYTATAVVRLQKQGAVVWGTSNMDEFAMGSSNETSFYGPCRNPIHRDYVPGGSSGGSASAVGGGQALCALGSDTGGSVRQPAVFCGITGIKPTYGRVSRYGLVAFGSSLDQIGPIAKTAEDCAILLEQMAGEDIRDATASKEPVDCYTKHLGDSLKGKKIAIPESSFDDNVHGEVKRSLLAVKDFYQKQGCVVEEIPLDLFSHALECYYVIALVELTSNLSRFDGVRYGNRMAGDTLDELYIKTRTLGFGEEAKRRCMMGNIFLQKEYLKDYYEKASDVRKMIVHRVRETFKKYDVILSPASPNRVFKFGEKSGNPVDMYKSDLFLTTANIAGIPAVSFSVGRDSGGLPLGVNLMGRFFDESTILNLAHVYQNQNPAEF